MTDLIKTNNNTVVRVTPPMRTGFFKKHCLAAMLLMLVSPSVFSDVSAETKDETFSDMSLDELMTLDVFSAASRLPTKHSQAAGTVYSFERKDFARMGVRRVDDLFQFVPGMQMNQYRKRHLAIWSRGLLDRYNDKLILMVDGVQLRHLYYGHFSLGDNFPLEKIEKVEIIQGPASSLYGANAFGGIISITTRKFAAEGDSEIELTGEVGNNKRKKITGLASASKIQIFGSHLDQDAPFREERKSFIGGDTLQPLDEDYSNLFIKGTPTEGLTLSLDYYENDTPFLFIPDTQDAFIEEKMLTLSARHEIGDLEKGKLETTAYYTDDRATEFEIDQDTRDLGYHENQDSIMAGVTITGFKRLFEKHVFALGVSWQHEQARDMDFVRTYSRGNPIPPESGSLLSDPDISNNNYAVFVQDVWQLNRKTDITLGARYDEFEQFGSHINFRGALVYSPDVQQTWKLLYGTAIRTPSFREYLKVLEGTDFVAPVPDPEQIRSLELAYLHQWQRANISITLYHNEVEDFIHEVPTPSTPSDPAGGADEYFANSEDTLNMNGIDALLNYSLDEDLLLRLNASYLDAESISAGKTPYLASWTAGFNLSYAYSKNHNLGFSVVYNNDRPDTNAFPDDDPGAFTAVNVFGSGQIIPQLSYGYGIDNLFDELIFDPAADFGGQHNTERSVREFWIRLQWSPDI